MERASDGMTARLLTARMGLALCVATILYGFVLGGVFGVFEDRIKSHFRESAMAAATGDASFDEAAAERLAGRSWSYLKRAHMHANGIGTASLAMTLFLVMAVGRKEMTRWIGLALGIGALGYSSFWMFAAMRTPALGSTDAAKASLEWLAIPSAALLIVGAVSTLVLILFGRLGNR